MQHLSNKVSRIKSTDIYSSTRETIKKSSLYQNLDIAAFDLASSFAIKKYASCFKSIKTFCLFIGHGRSGHSIIGALLDAHPNVILSDETDALKYLSAGFRSNQIFYVLLRQSQKHARLKRRKKGRDGKMYSYWVPGQWQGRFEYIKVIGDSKAGVSAQKLSKNPDLFNLLQNTFDVNLKFIQIVRNPFDNISTMCIRGKKTLSRAIDDYYVNCDAVEKIYQYINADDLLIARHEDLIENPQKFLRTINHFIGVDPFDDYLNACASIIYKSPAKSRQKIYWDKSSVQAVRNGMKEYEFLAEYSHEE